jgi:hypothetical protein
MAKYHNECHNVLKGAQVFPIEVDLTRSTFAYHSLNQFNDGTDADVQEDTEEDSAAGVDTSVDLKGAAASDVDLISTDY